MLFGSTMKTTLRLLTVTALLLGLARVSSANAIVNGSFEILPSPLPASHWALYETIPGWTSPVNFIEVGWGSIYGVTGYDGQNVLELDATGNAIVSQIVAVPTETYLLSFLYADRAGVPTSSATFQVYWNNVLVASLAPTSTAMTLFQLNVVGDLDGTNDLEFRGTGTQDSLGAIIDGVRLPDGGLTSALLGLSIVGLGVVRRMVG